MKKSHLLGAVCACLFFSINANAASLLPSSSGPGYFVTDNCIDCPGLTDINIEVLTNGTPIHLDFNAIGAPFEDITITLDNLTGSNWNQVTMELIPTFDPFIPVSLGFDTLAGFYSAANVTGILTNPFTLSPSGIEVSFTPSETTGMFVHGTANFLSDPFLTYTISITTNPVPIPAAVWLFGSGLLGLVGIARRKKA